VAKATGARPGINMIIAVTAKGAQRFSVSQGSTMPLCGCPRRSPRSVSPESTDQIQVDRSDRRIFARLPSDYRSRSAIGRGGAEIHQTAAGGL